MRKGFDSAAFYEELGDAVVTEDTIAEYDAIVKEQGEDTPSDQLFGAYGTEITSAETPSLPPDSGAGVSDGADENLEDPDSSDSFDEKIKILEEQQRSFQQAISDYVGRQMQGQPPAQQAQTQEEVITDPNVLLARMAQQMQVMTERLEAQEKLNLNREASRAQDRFQSAVKTLTEKYPDFHEFIPQTNLQNAFKQAQEQKQFDLDWLSGLEQNYKSRAFDKYANTAKQQADELARKRSEKQDDAAKKAKGIAPGGSAYQAPVAQRKPGDYRSARNAMLAELESLG